jgi:hypothetical protein
MTTTASTSCASAGADAFQREFAAALRHPGGDDAALPPFARQPGFAVYRNTVRVACLEALQANYPTVRQVVGDGWFAAAGRAFVDQHWPRHGSLADYGDAWPAFLAAFAPAAELPYLPAVARLDRLWTESHLAADAPVLDAAALAELDAAQLVRAVLVPHPATRWAAFADLPAITIWRRHREHHVPGGELDWRGEAALLTRPAGAVEWLAIDAAAATFLDACAAGRTFADAALAAGDALPAQLPQLFAAGAFTRIET